MPGDLKLAAELDFTPEVVVAVYDEPVALPPFGWRWWPDRLRWTGHRRVRRGFVLRARTLRELITDQLAFDQLAATYTADPAGFLTARCIVVTGSMAIPHVPAKALREIDATYRRVNDLPELVDPTEAAAGTEVTFDSVMRRLEREPFHYTRDEILAMTAGQLAARLREWGEEKQNDALRAAGYSAAVA